ncbi:MAG: SDR family oxidoreductase [Chloroflexi bacterium]|nr:SDR family oxidoreductase [Chloroflexota bacterium]
MVDRTNILTNPSTPRAILITGASSGIGEATARLFAAQGYRVALAARRMERLEALAEQIRAAGGQALPVAADLSRPEDIQRMVEAARQAYGEVDILFNNAGFGRMGWLETLRPAEDIEAQLQVNLLGMIAATRALLPHMLASRQGHIINMASSAAFIATPTYTIYAASKHAVRGFSEALRREVRGQGVHVSAIYPGGVATEFKEHMGYQRKSGVGTPAALRLSAEQVARGVLSLARRPRRSLILPASMRLAIALNALFPGLVDWAIERGFTRRERRP